MVWLYVAVLAGEPGGRETRAGVLEARTLKFVLERTVFLHDWVTGKQETPS